MEDRCVMCGDIVPEGTQVCSQCKLAISEAPCKGCHDRTVECHIYCIKYLMYFSANERLRDIKLKQNGMKEYWAKKAKRAKAKHEVLSKRNQYRED